jgi:L-fuculose-phosphate aldolase
MIEKIDVLQMHPSILISTILGRIYKRGLTTTSGGNISIMDMNGDMWVTPAGVDKGSLLPADIICVKSDGTIIGPHQPSSEYPLHKAVYASRPDIKAIIHAHPPALVSFSIVRQIPNTSVTIHSNSICGPTGYARYELPGSEKLGVVISDEFKKGFNAIIMENHGAVVGGSNMSDAYQRFETLEFTARTILHGKAIGEVKYLTDTDFSNYIKHEPELLQEMDVISYPPDEGSKRIEIWNIVQRACNQGLMISSYGTVSMRWHDNDFIITPSRMSRWDMEFTDMVQIKDGKREPGKIPSRMVNLHHEIYKQNPKINSIIATQTPYINAFGATHTPFNVRTIPESWIFLRDLPSLPFSVHFQDPAFIAEKFTTGNPAVIIENDAIIVTGNKPLQTFDYLEVAEFSAKSIVMSNAIGKMVPMNDRQIEDLRVTFLQDR